MRFLTFIVMALGACAEPLELGTQVQEIGQDRDTGEPVYPDIGGDGNDGDDTDDNDGAMECRTVTISGSVFYNDLRSTGRFADRYSPTGAVGSADPYTATPVTSQFSVQDDNRNYLGLRDAVIDLYEVDDTTSGEGCVETSYVGGVTINSHGEYTWTGQVCDACDHDHDGANDNGVSLAGRIRLRFCNDTRCFSVRDSLGMPTSGTDHYADTFAADPYRRWLRGASLAAPKLFAATTSATLDPDYFQASASQSAGDPEDLDAQAASVYASLVDTTRVLHVTHGVPYDRDRFGEVQVFYPSVLGGDDGGGAHSHQPEDKGTSRFCVESQMDGIGPWTDPPPMSKPPYLDLPGFYGPEVYDARQPEAWFHGRVVAHEYGHLVHYWQWDGFGKWTSFCYDDAACEEGGAPEFTLAALKEGWADFIDSVVWHAIPNGSGCDNIESRSPSGAPYPEPPDTATLSTIGRRWMPDVEQALCDLWDSEVDAATYGGITFDDHASTSLVDLVSHLGWVWISATSTERAEITGATTFGPTDTATTPLGICNFVELYPNNASWIEALKVTGIDCGL
jgi:hypothetical protein